MPAVGVGPGAKRGVYVDDDIARNVVLHFEPVLRIAVIALRPGLNVGKAVD